MDKDGSPIDLLIVDDDDELRDEMVRFFSRRGHRVSDARDGEQALDMVQLRTFDVVILDMMMPKRSGFLGLEKLRRSYADPIRVIMITANEGSRHKAYAEMLGVDDYIRKPFAMDRLIESVERLIGAQ